MKNKLKYRSMQPELMDSLNVSSELLIRNLKELDFLNRTLGGHALSMQGVMSLMNDRSRTYHIVDLGCGSGDWLRYMAKKARQKRFYLKLTGVDKNPDAIEYLKKQSRDYPEIEGYAGDYSAFLNHSAVDVFHCSLFCHHLSDTELVKLLSGMKATAGAGFVINDLQRSLLAYYGVKAFTYILGGSMLSKHDGPVSVLRGFKKQELLQLLHEAGVENPVVSKRHLFRLLVVGRTSDPPENNNLN